MPSEVIDAVTGATNQAWIDKYGADIKNIEAKISVLNDKIVDLEIQRDNIPPVSPKPKRVSMKGSDSRDRQVRINVLQEQIDGLYKNRDELMDAIGWLAGKMQKREAMQIQEEYDAMLTPKKYINRNNQLVY
jgi:hypothetical protein